MQNSHSSTNLRLRRRQNDEELNAVNNATVESMPPPPLRRQPRQRRQHQPRHADNLVNQNAAGEASRVKIAIQIMDDEYGKYVAHTLPYRIVKALATLYTNLQAFLTWAKLLRGERKTLNELTLEGLTRKKLEIFFFDFYDEETLQQFKCIIRGFITAIFFTTGLYFMMAYFLSFPLTMRVLACCSIGSVLVTTLSFSQPIRSILYLTLPSMAKGNVKSAMLIGAFIFASAGPLYNVKCNLDALKASRSCLDDELWSITSVVNNLRSYNIVKGRLIAWRMALTMTKMALDAIFRLLFAINHAMDKLLDVVKRKLEAVTKFLSIFRLNLNFKGACHLTVRGISRKYRRTELVAGMIRALEIVSSVFTSKRMTPPHSKPTIGYYVQNIGMGVCQLLDKAKKIYRRVESRVNQWKQKFTKPMLKVKAAMSLLNEMLDPDTAVIVRFAGGADHQLRQMRDLLKYQVLKKTKKLKETQRAVSYLLQLFSSAFSIIMLGITFGLAIRFYIKFMRDDKFENVYITAAFVRLEEIEKPILPLDNFEKQRISHLTDAMMSNFSQELRVSVVIFAMIRCLPLLLLLAAEYFVYFGVRFLEAASDAAISVERRMTVDLTVEGGGAKNPANPLTVLFKFFILLQRSLRHIDLDVNVLACKPLSVKPNSGVDFAIVVLVFFYFLFTLTGPFFLRMRHKIMIDLHPERALERAIWLRRHIEADRELLPKHRDLFGQTAEKQDSSALSYLVQTHLMDKLNEWSDTLRGLLSLPTVRCGFCGVRGNLSAKRFDDTFTACDNCCERLCVQCMHVMDETGQVTVRADCPVCGGQVDEIPIDEENLEDLDPLNRLLVSHLELSPDYCVSRLAVDAHARETQERREEWERGKEREMGRVLGLGQVM